MNLNFKILMLVILAALLPVNGVFADDAAPGTLTLQQAHEMAITNHPKITEAELIALRCGDAADDLRVRPLRAGSRRRESRDVARRGRAQPEVAGDDGRGLLLFHS